MNYPAHPAASIFPMMTEDQLKQLALDIGKSGLLHSIVLLDGMVLDGRNRLAACRLASVEPRFEHIIGVLSPTEYVLSANLERRHLTNAQRAAVAVESKALFQAEARARQRAGQERGRAERFGSVGNPTKPSSGRDGRAMAQAAALVGIHTDTAYDMEKVKRNAPDVFEAVKRGEVRTIAQAKRLMSGESEPRKDTSAATAASAENRKSRTSELDTRIDELFKQALTSKEIAERLGCKVHRVQAAKKRLGFVAERTPVNRAVLQLVEFADGCRTITRIAPWTDADAVAKAELLSAVADLKRALNALSKRLNNDAAKGDCNETPKSEDRTAVH